MMDQQCWNNSDGADVQHIEQVHVNWTVFAKCPQIQQMLYLVNIFH